MKGLSSLKLLAYLQEKEQSLTKQRDHAVDTGRFIDAFEANVLLYEYGTLIGKIRHHEFDTS